MLHAVTTTRPKPVRRPVTHQRPPPADSGATIMSLVVSIAVTALMLPVMLGVATDTLKLTYLRAERISSAESNSRLTALFSSASTIDGCATLAETNDKGECAVVAKSGGVALLGDNTNPVFDLPPYSLCVLTTHDDTGSPLRLRQRRCLALEGDTDNVDGGVDTSGGGNLTIRSWDETDPTRFIPMFDGVPDPDKHEQVVYRDVEWWCAIFTTTTGGYGECPNPDDPFERYPQTTPPSPPVYGPLQQQYDLLAATGTPGCGGVSAWWRVSDDGDFCDGTSVFTSTPVPNETALTAVPPLVPLIPEGLHWTVITQRLPDNPVLIISIEMRVCIAIDADERLERLNDPDLDGHCELNVLGFTLAGSQ